MRGKLAKKLRKIAYEKYAGTWEDIRSHERASRERGRSKRYKLEYDSALEKMIKVWLPGTMTYPGHSSRYHYKQLKREVHDRRRCSNSAM